MVNLRKEIEEDLSFTLEGEDFGLPVELIGPDGLKQSVTGQVLFDTVRTDPETGQPVLTGNPVVTVRRSSLSPIPGDTPGEVWQVRIPGRPDPDADLVDYVASPVHANTGGASIGFLTLHLQKASQTP